MKKFAYLLLALALILAISPAAFAEGETTVSDGSTVTVPANELVLCLLQSLDPVEITVTGADDQFSVGDRFGNSFPKTGVEVVFEAERNHVAGICFVIVNESNAEKTFSIGVKASSSDAEGSGTESDPEIITDVEGAEYTAVLPEAVDSNEESAYYYMWTAPCDGQFYYSVMAGTMGVQYEVTMFNRTTREPNGSDILDPGMMAELDMIVSTGDVILIKVENHGNPKTGMKSEDRVTGMVDFYPIGSSAGYPIYVNPGTEFLSVPAHSTRYFCLQMMQPSALLTIDGEDYTVTYNGKDYTTCTELLVEQDGNRNINFSITNNSNDDAQYTMSLGRPQEIVGTYDNPEEIEDLGTPNDCTLGDDEYYYFWVPEKDGYMLLTVTGAPEDVGYYIVLNGGDVQGDFAAGEKAVLAVKVESYSAVEICFGKLGLADGIVNFELGFCEGTNTELVGKKDATCTEKGYTGDLVCKDEDCGAVLVKGKEIPALNHKNTELVGQKDATCTEKGYTGDLICSDCGELIEKGHETDALGHKYVEKDGKEVCEHCGEPKPTNPETADTASALIAVIAVLSLGGAVALVENRKKF